ncbi:MAG: hypothetical protein IJO40_14110, partial [Thermoguttaceae bacterium]|nr:hypothetical protein [Thermoguttaceae bacterium]
MRLQGWKTAAAGALFCSLGWGAANGVWGADGLNGWITLDDSAVVLTTDDENGELNGEAESNDEAELNGGL